MKGWVFDLRPLSESQ